MQARETEGGRLLSETRKYSSQGERLIPPSSFNSVLSLLSHLYSVFEENIFFPAVFIIQYTSVTICRVVSRDSGHCPKEAACRGRKGRAAAVPLW